MKVYYNMIGEDSTTPPEFKTFVDADKASFPGVSHDGINRVYTKDYAKLYEPERDMDLAEVEGSELIIANIPQFSDEEDSEFTKIDAIKMMAVELTKPSNDNGKQRVIRAERGVFKALHNTPHWRRWCMKESSFTEDKQALGMPEDFTLEQAKQALIDSLLPS